MLAIEGFRKNTRGTGFSDASDAGEEESMGDSIALDFILEGLGDMLLTDDVIEALRSPFS